MTSPVPGPRSGNPCGWRRVAAFAIALAATRVDAAPATQAVALVTDPAAKISVEAVGWLGLSPILPATESGLVPIQIRVVNGGARDAVVTVDRSASRFSFGSSGIVAPRSTFRVPAGETVTQTEFVDPLEWQDTPAQSPMISMVGRTTGTRTDVELGVTWSFSGSSATTAAVPGSPEQSPQTVREATAPRVYSAAALGLLRPAGEDWPLKTGAAEGEIDLAAAPDDWRGYTALREIVVADGDWTTLPSGQRRAMLGWVGLGGLLEVVCADADAERLDRLGLPRADAQGRRRVGAGEVMIVPPGEATWNALHGLGGPLAEARPPMRRGAGSWRAAGFARVAGFNARGIPFTPILTFLALFAIVAGPLNVMLLAGSGRPARIFWTTPLIALAATAVLLSLMLLRDGIGGEGARLTLCLLDPDRNAAHVLQQQVSRTGVLLGSSFPIRETSWMHPEPATDAYDIGGAFLAASAARAFTEIDGSRRAGDWFSSRSDQAFTFRAVRSNRGRLVVSGPPESPEIVSSIDAALARVVVVDAEGRTWRCGALGPGERRPLEPATDADRDAVRVECSVEASPAIGMALDRLLAARGYAWAQAAVPAEVAIASLDAIRWKVDRAWFVTPIAPGEEP